MEEFIIQNGSGSQSKHWLNDCYRYQVKCKSLYDCVKNPHNTLCGICVMSMKLGRNLFAWGEVQSFFVLLHPPKADRLEFLRVFGMWQIWQQVTTWHWEPHICETDCWLDVKPDMFAHDDIHRNIQCRYTSICSSLFFPFLILGRCWVGEFKV